MSETLLTAEGLRAPRASHFEALFSASERDLEAAVKAEAELRKHVAAAHKAASAGEIRVLSRALQAARAVLAELDASLERAGDVLTHDLTKALADGAYAAEIERQAKADGLRGVRNVHGLDHEFPRGHSRGRKRFLAQDRGQKVDRITPISGRRSAREIAKKAC